MFGISSHLIISYSETPYVQVSEFGDDAFAAYLSSSVRASADTTCSEVLLVRYINDAWSTSFMTTDLSYVPALVQAMESFF